MNRKKLIPLIAMLMLALASLACGLDVNALLNPLPSDNFSNSGSGWGTGTDTQSSVEYKNGGLQMVVYDSLYMTWSTPNITSYENTHMEVTVKDQSSDPKAFYGFVCNGQGSTSSFYYVGVSPDGYYAFVKAAVAKDDVFLKEGNSSLIQMGAANPLRLGLDCANGSLSLYANGQLIDSVSDSTYASGSVGLFAASDEMKNGVYLTFDDFAVTKLEK
jgi:hypothetical protein